MLRRGSPFSLIPLAEFPANTLFNEEKDLSAVAVEIIN